MEKQKNIEIEVKSANVEEGNASAILTETDGKVAFDKVAKVAMLMFLVIVSLLLICVNTRAHNLCHDNRQLIVIAINRNRSAIKINCN